jgi:hypothetical protein
MVILTIIIGLPAALGCGLLVLLFGDCHYDFVFVFAAILRLFAKSLRSSNQLH